ncbi:MAG: hypothetical protein EBT66_03650 [Bacteroidetes bacterium]|nr:hypothetical protein [Bacteroidota bacterium]
MLDFHNHLLPGIDDGSPDVETSMMLFQGMADLGFTDIICTPHIIADTHPNNPETIQKAAEYLQSEASRLGVNLNYRFAAEYMLDDTFQHALSTKQPLLKLHKNRILVEQAG